MQQYNPSLSIGYELTQADRLGFSLYHSEHSPTYQSTRRRYQLTPPVVWMTTALAILLFLGWNAVSMMTLIGFSILSLLWFLLAPNALNNRVKKQTQKMLNEGQVRSREAITLSLAPEGVQVVGEDVESRYKWSAVQKIATTSTHIYLYVNPVHALVVPKSAFAGETACDHFLETVRRCREQAAGLIA